MKRSHSGDRELEEVSNKTFLLNAKPKSEKSNKL